MTAQPSSSADQSEGSPLQFAQQGDVMTATGFSIIKSAACEMSINNARQLCVARGYNNITHVNCECTQDTSLPSQTWNCVGTANVQ